MAPTSDEELKLMLYSGELSQLGPADRFLEVLQFSEFVNARNLALESVNLDHMLIWRTRLPSILDDIEDRDEESDGSLRGRFTLETMRSSHPMYFAKKPTEEPAQDIPTWAEDLEENESLRNGISFYKLEMIKHETQEQRFGNGIISDLELNILLLDCKHSPTLAAGTYNTVFQARDLESGKIVVLKKVRFDNFEPESVCFMAQEIMILRRLDHPNINKVGGINYFPIIMQHISGVLRT
ncbi:putative serine/threonine-protein kinase [Forsythia ovata]|uniref:Serine/threonine-protein kinase n=1 Tax=Forsythia ovata TaxID=205694 RepID=A0ABD1S050_9LAMI